MKKPIEGICPVCDSPVYLPLEDAYKGNIVHCPNCGSKLEIIEDSPVEFEEIFEDDGPDL